MSDHGRGHTLSIGLFTAKIGDHCAFRFSCYEMDIDGLLLPEPPETADGLKYLLEAVIEADKAGIGAMLPVHSEPGERWFRDQNADAPFREINKDALLVVVF